MNDTDPLRALHTTFCKLTGAEPNELRFHTNHQQKLPLAIKL